MTVSALDDAWDEHLEHLEALRADEAAAHEAESDAVLIPSFTGTLQLAETTEHKYQRCLWEFKDFLDATGVKSVRAASRHDVQRFLRWLAGDEAAAPLLVYGESKYGHRPPREALSPSSRKGHLSALRAFYRFCLDEGYALLNHDPTTGIRAPKVKHRPGLTLSTGELQRFLDAPGSERDRIQAYLLVFTAQRAGAISDLRWRDVNWEERELTFIGKNTTANVISIHDELLGALSRWRRAVVDEAETKPLIAAALYNPDTAYVLLTRGGRRVTVQTLGKQTKWRAARCGLRLHVSGDASRENKSQVHPHMFRRTWATLQRKNAVPIEDIADVLAHKSIDTTRTHYAFAPAEAKRKAVKNFSL